MTSDIFVEHNDGWSQFWCAPEQIRVITANNQANDYTAEITQVLDGIMLDKSLEHNKLRYTVDNSDDSLYKKIRRATAMKIPAVLVVGPKDVEDKVVSFRLL